MPGISASFPEDSTRRSWVVFFRSLQGFVTMPPKPPVATGDLEVLPVSGKDW